MGRFGLRRVYLLQIASDHQLHDAVVIRLFAFERSGVGAVAQHDDAVGDLCHLAQPV